jgi:hypothetical protein
MGGAVEGFNNHAKLTMRRSFGFRTFTVIELALFHTLGSKPVVGGASAPGGVEIGHHQLPYRLLRRDPAQKRDAVCSEASMARRVDEDDRAVRD